VSMAFLRLPMCHANGRTGIPGAHRAPVGAARFEAWERLEPGSCPGGLFVVYPMFRTPRRVAARLSPV
jgi:hypothetical protein